MRTSARPAAGRDAALVVRLLGNDEQPSIDGNGGSDSGCVGREEVRVPGSAADRPLGRPSSLNLCIHTERGTAALDHDILSMAVIGIIR